jgi:tetratricopeptide (TPR) repeat protein
MERPMRMFAVAVFVSSVLIASAVAQDSVQLKDGRFVLDKKMTRTKKGVTVHFKNGDVFIPDAMVMDTTARAVDGSLRKLSPKDQEKVDKGLVFFNGRWMSQKAADRRRAKIKQVRLERIKEAKAHQAWKDRHIDKTRNFQFEYTIDPRVMEDFSNMMETYYKVFTKEWRIKKPRKLGRLKVCFYHDEDYFHQVSGAPGGVLGYFRFVQPIELNFYYDRMDEDYTYDVMFHEANHYLTYLIDPQFRYPLWVNEGLAEYYGASEYNKKTKKMTVGALQEGRLAVIQERIKTNLKNKSGTGSEVGQAEWMGLEQLIDETARGITSLHYAWAWSFMHFVFHGQNGKYESKFKKFYLGLAKDGNIRRTEPDGYRMRTIEPAEQKKALKRYLGVSDLKTLEKEWHDYVRQLKAVGPRGKMRAGQFALWSDMPIKAQRLLNEAIEAGSTSPLTWYYLGQAQYRKRKYTEAAESFKKVIEMDPLNGMAYIRLARCKKRQDADEEEVKKLRKLAREFDPDNYTVILETWDLEDE